VSLETELADVVGPAHVLTDPALTSSYAVDWTGRFVGSARAVVRPATTEQVAAVVTLCAAYGAAVVPQGGNTGLVGGGTPRGADQVVLSTRRLAVIDPVDVGTREVTAQAGVTIGDLQRAAVAAGLRYGVDLASRDSATLGGTVATNAGGLRVVRHGTTRAQVRGLEVVLADGRVASRLAPPPQDNAGLDLTDLLVGSEGTLAIVTAARVRLVAPSAVGFVVLVGCGSVDEAISLLPASGLRAAEVMLAAGLDLVRRVAGLSQPLSRAHPVYLLLETDELPDLSEDVDAAVDPGLWAYRERHTEAIATLGVARKLDVSLPLGSLGAFVGELAGAVAPYSVFVFGHLAMGNLHVNVLGLADSDESVDERVLRLVASYGGSIAAEHGIGVAKREWLSLTRSPTEIDLMRAIKASFDPNGLLNPGVMLPTSPSKSIMQ
jgi:FAD/FMN-containing dehydrogenase